MWLDIGGYSLWQRGFEVALPQSGSREREMLGFSPHPLFKFRIQVPSLYSGWVFLPQFSLDTQRQSQRLASLVIDPRSCQVNDQY